jgi:hypothetical protein
MSEETLYADGFEDALIGLAQQFNRDLAVYDFNKCIDILVAQGMTHEEAHEYMDFNVTGAWVGEYTPLFLKPFL